MTRTISIKSYSRLLFAVRKSFSFAALRLRYWLPHTATAWGPAVPSCSAREVLITHRGWILNPCLCKGGFPLTSHTVAAHNLCLWGGEQWNPVKPHIFSFRPFTIGASISTPLITIGSGRPPGGTQHLRSPTNQKVPLLWWISLWASRRHQASYHTEHRSYTQTKMIMDIYPLKMHFLSKMVIFYCHVILFGEYTSNTEIEETK